MAINWILESVDQSPSTNEDLMVRWRAGQLWEPIARKAIIQTSGKGRLGRSWVSHAKQALTFSVAYPFKKNISELSGLSLACGLAVIKGISTASGISQSDLKKSGLGLKWPNDIFLNNKKLAGMLLEGGQLDASQATWIVIGIGINLTADEDLEKSIKRPIASLDQINKIKAIDADVLWLAILKELAETIELFEQHSFIKFQEEWNSWDIYKNQNCVIVQNEQLQFEGFERGVDAEGHLLIESNNKLQKIISGDVSLKAKP
jgi:BirA family transcriptional regulator, biotin operon repressor / biotin---[acetyl-CoA-carboxylase] ligase